MPYQTIYKDMGVEDEVSFGASVAGTAERLHIRTNTFNLDPNKELVEDTISTSKGRDRIVSRRNEIEGDMTLYGSVRNLHHSFEWVNGEVATAAGASLSVYTYPQNTSGNVLTKTINLDRNNSQEKFSGVYVQTLELTAANDLLEITLNGGARTRSSGLALPDNVIGETVKPFNFVDISLTVHRGATYGSNIYTYLASEWNMSYDNGMERTHLSGSKDAARVDPKVPTLSGMIRIFHEGTSWVSAFEGASEFYLRFQGTLPSSSGLINGTTPYLLRIDVPRVEATTSIRNYEQNELSVEEINWTAMADLSPAGLSALWRPQLTTRLNEL